MKAKQKLLYLKDFGFGFTTKAYFYQLMVNKSKGNKKIKWCEKLNEYKLKKLDNLYEDFIKKIYQNFKNQKNDSGNSKLSNNTIWLFWMQGNIEDNPMINMCNQSIISNLPKGYNIVIINKDNIKEYSDISPKIWDKFSNGKITITHLSDILRMNLLSKYGGIWFDATMYCTGSLDSIFNKDFWSIKREASKSIYISKGKWTIFAIGGQNNNPVFYLMNKLLEQYYIEYDVLIDYFLTDFFMELIYRNIEEIKIIIDENSYNNINVHKLYPLLSEKFDEKKYKEITENTNLFKLSWRKEQLKKVENELTFYGKLIEGIERNEN
jgi:hypothetical protein